MEYPSWQTMGFHVKIGQGLSSPAWNWHCKTLSTKSGFKQSCAVPLLKGFIGWHIFGLSTLLTKEHVPNISESSHTLKLGVGATLVSHKRTNTWHNAVGNSSRITEANLSKFSCSEENVLMISNKVIQ